MLLARARTFLRTGAIGRAGRAPAVWITARLLSEGAKPAARLPDAVPSMEPPSAEDFTEMVFKRQAPVILRGCVSHWPAISGPPDRLWENTAALKERVGHYNVPVEVRHEIAPLGEYIDYCQGDAGGPLPPSWGWAEGGGEGGEEMAAYLAQHQLFEHVEELIDDVEVPAYCFCGRGDQYTRNAWVGRKGTVSPLHYDPYCNILAQVVGSKRVLLFAPDQGPNLYPYEEFRRRNSSRVDPENVDQKSFPRAVGVPAMVAEIAPGDALFIPARWWHHVRSLTFSISVNFFFL